MILGAGYIEMGKERFIQHNFDGHSASKREINLNQIKKTQLTKISAHRNWVIAITAINVHRNCGNWVTS